MGFTTTNEFLFHLVAQIIKGHTYAKRAFVTTEQNPVKPELNDNKPQSSVHKITK